MTDDLDNAADNARRANGTSYDWTDSDPAPRLDWPKLYAIAVAAAAVLALLFSSIPTP